MSEQTEAVSAPVLSTAQDEEELFSKVQGYTDETLREKRRYLGPKYCNSKNITKEEVRDIISEYYSLDKLTKYLNSRNAETGDLKFPSVSLQFPDDLICDSTIVASILQESLNTLNKEFHDSEEAKEVKEPSNEEIDFTQPAKMNRDIESVEKTIDSNTCGGNCGSKCKNKSKFHQDVWILADTSYSPCCIDEVAAEHIKADIVVHFGDACLNPVDKINSCYVFGKPYIDLMKLKETFQNTYIDKDEKVVLMSSTPYSYMLPELKEILKEEGYKNIIVSHINYSKSGLKSKIIDEIEQTGKGGINTADRILTGFNENDINEYLETVDFDDENYIESCKYDGLTQEYSLFHLSRPHDARLLLLSTKFNELKIVDTDDIEIVHDQFPTLMKRYRNMQVARTASTVGVLVNTLSLANTRGLLNEITKSIVEAGKKHYMFVVGKPNVAKLANFDVVDAWCIIGCGQSGIVVDMYGDYYKPIITPYELELALRPQVTWTGKWVTDFESLLRNEKTNESEKSEENLITEKTDEEEVEDDYAPEFDPVTGKLKMNQPLRQLRHLELELESESSSSNKGDENALVQRFSGTLSMGNTVSMSAMNLQSREWTGLGSDFTNEDSTEGALVEEGRTGIARGYSGV